MTIDILIDCIAVLIGDYDATRKKAAYVLLKYFAPKDIYEFVMEELEKEAPVIDRRDPRVTKWRKEVIKLGQCKRCGATERLEAHHVAHWAESPNDRINPNNGECLCHKCHTKEHEGEQVHSLMLAID